MKKNPKLVCIVGGSCTGKTTLEHNLQKILGDRLTIFSFDDMFIGIEEMNKRKVKDFEDPDLYRWDDYVGAIKSLQSRRRVKIAAHSRESAELGIGSKVIEPNEIILVGGFLTLHDSLVRNLFDIKIFIELPEKEIIRRRRARAGNEPWDTTDYIDNMLIPGHRRFVVPQKKFTDYIVDGMLDPKKLAQKIADLITG